MGWWYFAFSSQHSLHPGELYIHDVLLLRLSDIADVLYTFRGGLSRFFIRPLAGVGKGARVASIADGGVTVMTCLLNGNVNTKLRQSFRQRRPCGRKLKGYKRATAGASEKVAVKHGARVVWPVDSPGARSNLKPF